MTKTAYAKNLLQMIDNCRSIDGATDDEIVHNIESFLEPLEPVSRVRFANWGDPEHRATPDACWPDA